MDDADVSFGGLGDLPLAPPDAETIQVGTAFGDDFVMPAPEPEPARAAPPPPSPGPQAARALLSPPQGGPSARAPLREERVHALPDPPMVYPGGETHPRSAPGPRHRHPHQMMRTRPHHMRGYGEDTPESASNLLGLALVAVPVGGYVGGRYAGALGVVGGALGAGAVVNGIRAARNFWGPQTPESSNEAIVSATYAVLGLAVAGYLIYRGGPWSAGSAKKNPPAPAKAAEPNKKKLWL